MPRRYPLLGTEDPQSVKAKRPFTTKAEQEIWDLGDPTKKRIILPPRISDFSRGMQGSKYPFVPDHSAPALAPRLKWHNEIQNLDYTLLLPDLFEGLTDKDPVYHGVAMLAIKDILKHGPVEKLIDALPTMTIAIKKAFAMNNPWISRRVIEALKWMCIIQPCVGPELAYYLREILVPLNYYFERTRDMNDQIVYNEKLYTDMYDAVDELIKLLLGIAGPEIDEAEKNVKKAIPTYQLFREN